MEWEIVTVIIALVGLLTTVTKPILNLTKTITKLNHTCQNLEERMERFENHNHDSHVKIWAHNDKQDAPGPAGFPPAFCPSSCRLFQ